MAKNRNGTGPIITVVEAGRLVGQDARVVKRWIDGGKVPNLAVKIGDRLYVRRLEVEKLIKGNVDYDGVDRVTILSKSGVPSRVPPDVAHAAICLGATIPADALSFKVYERWLNKQRDALVEAPKPEREAESERKLAVIEEKLQWLHEQQHAAEVTT